MSQLRIAIVAPPWVPVPPPAYGGTEAVLDELARGLVQAGHEVALFTTGDSTCPVPRRWVYDRCQQPMGASAIELRHVLDVDERLGHFDIVHDHTLVGPVIATGRTDLPPVVTTNHGPFDANLSALYRYVTARSVSLIAISHHQASTALGIPIAAVIHHGIDVDRYPEGRGSDGHLLFLGRMSPDKGVDVAARAARTAGMKLLIAAKMREPEERTYFDEVVRPLLGADVEYVGEPGFDDKIRLLAGAVALVNPIRWPEPFGMVMIEALACGTPVVAFFAGAAPEIVDHGRTGFLCADEVNLAFELTRASMLSRDACRRAAASRFGAARMVADHVRLYRTIVEHRHVRPDDTLPSLAAIA